MLKTRTWIKLGAGLVVLLLAVFIAILAWPTSPPSPESIAKRGLKAPEKRSSLWNGTFRGPQDWMDQNWDAFAHWDKNPLGIHKRNFGQHLSELKASKDPKDQEEYRRLLELAKQWQENLLSRFPGLKIAYRSVPDDRNALKLLDELQQRLKETGSNLTQLAGDIRILNTSPWNPKAVQAWLDANRSTVDEFRTICLMPESSIKDLSFDADDWVFLENGQRALLTDARLASERGDLAASMESIQAAIALGTHLQGAESCTLLQNQFGEYILGQARSMVIKSILPNLPSSQTDLAAWETLLNPTVQTPADFARIMRSEWNEMMGNSILPALADPGEIQIPVADADQFLEACTNYYFETVNVNAPLALTDLPTHPDPFFDLSARSWRNRQLIEMLQWFPREDWERQQIRTGLTQAAFAILRSQPVPNDPIYGLPYQWNPETRELSLPQGPKFAHRPNRPIKLPDL